MCTTKFEWWREYARKRKAISLETKYEIIQCLEMGNDPKKDVAARFDILGRMCAMLFIQFCLKKIENILRSNNLSWFLYRGG
jgi:hypothetical protein